MPLHHRISHPYLYQRSAHVSFNTTLLTLTLEFIAHLQYEIY